MVSCDICCSVRHKTIGCPTCHQTACVDCVYRFMKETPYCMFCRETWSIDHLEKLFPKTKAVTLIKTKLFDDFNKRINTRYETLVLQHTHQLNVRNEMEQLKVDKRKLQESIGQVSSRLAVLQNQLSHPDAFSTPPPCGVFGCRGVQDAFGKCTICLMSTCEFCHERKDDVHVCDPGVLQSVSTITATCKPCPVCKVYISKVDGCDQMWCTKCKYAYSWKTGQLIKETSTFHNPHYFEELTGNLVSTNIDHITIGKLRGILMKLRKYDPECEMQHISRILNVRKTITELGFEYARFTRLIRTAQDREEKLQTMSIFSTITNESLKSKLYRSHKLILRKNTLRDFLQDYIKLTSETLLDLYESLIAKLNKTNEMPYITFNLGDYYNRLRLITESFRNKGNEFEQNFDCMFPFYTTETFLVQYMI